MCAYIASMCMALPVTLFPIELLHRAKIITRKRREVMSLRTGQFCARWLHRLIPFYKLTVIPSPQNPTPSVWVCNHQSMLDVFCMLAADKKMRGKNKRPIKVVYVSTFFSCTRVALCVEAEYLTRANFNFLIHTPL